MRRPRTRSASRRCAPWNSTKQPTRRNTRQASPAAHEEHAEPRPRRKGRLPGAEAAAAQVPGVGGERGAQPLERARRRGGAERHAPRDRHGPGLGVAQRELEALGPEARDRLPPGHQLVRVAPEQQEIVHVADVVAQDPGEGLLVDGGKEARDVEVQAEGAAPAVGGEPAQEGEHPVTRGEGALALPAGRGVVEEARLEDPLLVRHQQVVDHPVPEVRPSGGGGDVGSVVPLRRP